MIMLQSMMMCGTEVITSVSDVSLADIVGGQIITGRNVIRIGFA